MFSNIISTLALLQLLNAAPILLTRYHVAAPTTEIKPLQLEQPLSGYHRLVYILVMDKPPPVLSQTLNGIHILLLSLL